MNPDIAQQQINDAIEMVEEKLISQIQAARLLPDPKKRLRVRMSLLDQLDGLHLLTDELRIIEKGG